MPELNFLPFPVIVTPRLTLREITSRDTEDLFDLRNDVMSMKYIGKTIPATREEVLNLLNRIVEGYQKNSAITWGITLSGEGRLIGTIGYHIINTEHSRAEIGYQLISHLWRKGIMSEAMSEVLNYAFQKMNLHSIEARVDPDNKKSIGLLEKFSFVREGYLKESYYFRGRFMDTGLYSLLRS